MAPSRCASAANTRSGSLPVPIASPRRDQRVLDLEFADQRQPQGVFAAAMFQRELLRQAVDLGAHQANALA